MKFIGCWVLGCGILFWMVVLNVVIVLVFCFGLMGICFVIVVVGFEVNLVFCMLEMGVFVCDVFVFDYWIKVIGLIIIVGIFDGVDGCIVWMFWGESCFGVEFDLFLDVIVFGVLLVFIVYFWLF